jgi:predicted esterase
MSAPLRRIDGSALRFHLAGKMESPTALVLLLHGSGSHAGNLLPLADRLAAQLAGAMFVLPNAPQSYVEVLPPEQIAATEQLRPDIDWNLSRTWTASPPALDGDAEGRLRNLLDVVRPPVRALSRLADLLLALQGLSPASLGIYGFSQGGMMAAYLGLERPEPCAGIICHSGQFFGGAEVRSRSRTLVVVGARELEPTHVMSQVYPLTLRALRDLGVPVEEFVSDGLLHGINGEVIDRCAAFLRESLPQPDVVPT